MLLSKSRPVSAPLLIATLVGIPCASAQAPTPGETSGAPLAPLLVTAFDKQTRELTMVYQSACEATSNNVYIGRLDEVSNLTWSSEVCGIGTSGTFTGLDPGSDSYFFVVVGKSGSDEGPYGAQRSPYLANACGEIQNLTNTCTPAPPGPICSSDIEKFVGSDLK